MNSIKMALPLDNEIEVFDIFALVNDQITNIEKCRV